MVNNIFVKSSNATKAWEHWYNLLNGMNFDKQESRVGAVVGEVINAITVIENPRDGIVLSDIRNMSMKYAVGELMWYLSGSNQLKDITPYAKFWNKLTDDGVTCNSAYGHRIKYQFGFDQWEHVKDLLDKDNSSRQAVIHIKDASELTTKDTPCTVALQYLIRDGKLYATTYMRSNDIWLGFPYDVFTFTSLQVKMAMELGVDVGTYTHIAGSLHLYERNAPKEVSDGEELTQDTNKDE